MKIKHGKIYAYTMLKCRCSKCTVVWREHHLSYMNRHPEQRLRLKLYMRSWYRKVYRDRLIERGKIADLPMKPKRDNLGRFAKRFVN